jgi:hypothetical protein
VSTRKKNFLAVAFAIVVVGLLFAGLEERLIDGGPIHFVWLAMALLWFGASLAVFASGRKSEAGVSSTGRGTDGSAE